MSRHTKRWIRGLCVGLLAIGLAAAALVWPEARPVRGGMGWSALEGTINTSVAPSRLLVTFKVVDSVTGHVVWQSDPSDITVTMGSQMLTYTCNVDGTFRPSDPRYQWGMWVNAIRANDSVRIVSYTFDDIYGVVHHGVVPEGDVQGRIVEVYTNILQ